MKNTEKKRAIELRKQGLSYNEIRAKVHVSKSTLSLWLRAVGLAEQHARALTERQRITQKYAVEKWHQMRIDKTILIKEKAAAEISELTENERFLMGICLYWAEGTKERGKVSPVIFCNSDPRMIVMFREWLFDFIHCNPEDLKYSLYIHEMSKSISNAMLFWTNLLSIDPAELKIVLKRNKPSINRKNPFADYKGLVRISLKNSGDINRKISGWIDGIMSHVKVIGD